MTGLIRSTIPPRPTATGPTGVVTITDGANTHTVELVQGKAMAWSPAIAEWAAGADHDWLSAEIKRRGMRATFKGVGNGG